MSVTDRIYNDLRAKLARSQPLPAALTIPALAESYTVSFTPVRAALARLIAEGYVKKMPNGRCQPTGEGDPVPVLPPPETPELDAVLAAELVGRSLRGDAGFLREHATANRLGVGRTALRQVLGRLAGRGLVDYEPRRGWRVRAFRQADMVAYLEVREVLELKALDSAIGRLDPIRLERLMAANSPDGDRPQLDDDLHIAIIQASGNRYIADFFDRHRAYYHVVFAQAALSPENMEESAAEHRAILTALMTGDTEEARVHLAAHIRGQVGKVAAAFDRLAEAYDRVAEAG